MKLKFAIEYQVSRKKKNINCPWLNYYDTDNESIRNITHLLILDPCKQIFGCVLHLLNLQKLNLSMNWG